VETPSPKALTGLLQSWSRGDVAARDQLLPLVYAELRRRAAGWLRREGGGHTLQPTALVHEAYIRLNEQNAGWQNRSHFFGVASELMRRILVDHARARDAAKRPPKRMQVTVIPDEAAVSGPRELDLIALDAALDELAAVAPRQAQMVVLRFFGGLTHEEIASALGLSLSTVNREWRLARAWLYQRLAGGG
jgi:RNA polymerase sigma factor (TIGR02999 family)